MRLRQADRHSQRHRAAERELKPEDRAPACPDEKVAAEKRRDQRGDAQHQHHVGEDARRFMRAEEIAHAGARHHAARASADRLEEARDHQHLHAGGERTGRAHRQIEKQPRIERRLAAEAIRHRPEEGLSRREAQEERGERGFRRSDGNAEVARDGRQRGQVHVDGERAECRQRAQHDDKLDARRGGELAGTLSLQRHARHFDPVPILATKAALRVL